MVYNKETQYKWINKSQEHLQNYRLERVELTKENYNIWYNLNIEKERLRCKANSKITYQKKKLLKLQQIQENN